MAEATNPAGEIDFTSLGGLSQEEVNKRLARRDAHAGQR